MFKIEPIRTKEEQRKYCELCRIEYDEDYLAYAAFIDGAFSSSDYFPLLPWIFLFFFGTWLGRPLFDRKLPAPLYAVRSGWLAWCGRRSFYIYLVHQPILMGIVLLLQMAF